MSQLTEIAEIAGATTADVVRVASRGGTTARDWAIAHAIEKVTTRRAADIMWADGARVAAPEAPARTNPRAVYDPEVTVYGENTSPEDANRIAPHHPGDEAPEATAEDDEDAQVEEFAASVYSDLDDLLQRTTRSTARLVHGWATTAQARREVHAVMTAHPRTRDRVRAEEFAAALTA